jgi:gas vesicle protein
MQSSADHGQTAQKTPAKQPLLATTVTVATQTLPAILVGLREQYTRHDLATRVDGQIIGTGKADFTQGNTRYTLQRDDKTFALVDVPGIEGDEIKYTDFIREGVAQAHLVFYVNGTNKKPEQGTAKKIRSYLRYGTQVYPLINVRGNADAYEFDEDRVQLVESTALKQTTDVLKSVLPENTLLDGHCVQGLLGFSALAYDMHGRTSIHPSRDRDLVVQQRNYRKHFGSAASMLAFSGIQKIAQAIDAKRATFKQDIVESNKRKLRELLGQNLHELQEASQKYQAYLNRSAPEFDKCRAAFDKASASLSRSLKAGTRNLIDDLYNDLTGDADIIIDDDLGEAKRISDKITHAAKTRQANTDMAYQALAEQCIATLNDSLHDALMRLAQDVQRIEYQEVLSLGKPNIHFGDKLDDIGGGLKAWDYGAFALKVGSYATTGALIGSPIPGIGTLIGGAIGAAVGLLLGLLSLFTSRSTRVRKAQSAAREKIEEARAEALTGSVNHTDTQLKNIKHTLIDPLRQRIDALHQDLAAPIEILSRQIAAMRHLEKKLEHMEHGTIQAV